MIKNLFLVLILVMILFSCSPKKSNFQTDELIGVWSGILFQTESKYDSIIITPIDQPKEALLYKNGEKTNYPLILKDTDLKFKGSSGLRFDATISTINQTLTGVLTNDLWAQNLNFEKNDNKWVSKIHKPEIIDTDYRVYLVFYRDSVGDLQAKIQSNKENRKLHFTIKSVSVNRNNIDFKITADRFALSATYQSTTKKLSINYGNTNSKRKIELTKQKKNEWKGYTPRPVNKKYEYKIPQPLDSLIKTASLEDVGINSSLFGFMDSINNGAYEHIHSIIITKNKKLVFEEYFHGYHREYLHDIRSAFKSITSLVVGKAMMKNSKLKLSNTVLEYYPEYKITDTQKNNITIHHALEMSSGLENEDEDKMQWKNDDWVKYKLDHPMIDNPGGKYVYSDGGINLLSGVLQKSTNQYLPLFIQKELLTPMGINKFQMFTSPVGRGYLAGQFYLRPIDFTKFGLLMLNKGKWNGKQIITESWIEESTQPKIKSHHGYLWKLSERKVAGKQVKTIEAWGNGGQFLIIIPEIDMTISFTGGNYNLYPQMEEKPFEIINKYILPAIEFENN